MTYVQHTIALKGYSIGMPRGLKSGILPPEKEVGAILLKKQTKEPFMRPSHFRFAATLLLLVAIGLEANHSFIRQVPWRGFEPAANFASFPLITAWGLAIAGLWSQKATWKPWLIFGIFFLVAHGIVISTGGNSLAAAYIFAGLGAGACSALAHVRDLRARRTQEHRPNLRLAS